MEIGMKALMRQILIGSFTLLVSATVIFAQTRNCPELVNQALEAANGNCEAVGRNEACYGYDQVEASFLVDVSDDFFTQPSNISALADIETIRTAPLNTETGTWGVAVMNLQADLPNTIPGQSVTFILMGDVELENAVAPEDAFAPSDGVEVEISASAGANVRSGPGQNYNVLGGLQNGERVPADGFSEDGQWLRVAYRERPAWISLTVINDNNPALRDLPILSADLQTAMQAFYLRTGIGEAECVEAPNDTLFVQGPENINIHITVNGANIRLGSSGALRILDVDGESFLEISVFDGKFEIGDVTIERGERSVVCLGNADSRGLDGENNDLVATCDASPPEALDGAQWCNLEAISPSLLNYALDVPCPGETPAPTTGGQSGHASASEITGVDCSSFSVLTSTIPATNFTLSWSSASGADSYEVAIYDSSGFQTSAYSGLAGTSLDLNGGVGIASTGYIDVRAYRAGQYACYTRFNFIRSRDPNESIGRSNHTVGNISISASCSYNAGISTMEGTVSWSGLASGETINVQLVVSGGGFSDADSSSQSSGSMSLSAYSDIYWPATISVSTSDGSSYSNSC
jgi:hypothetical protein